MTIYKCAGCRLLHRRKPAKCARCGGTNFLKFIRPTADKKLRPRTATK